MATITKNFYVGATPEWVEIVPAATAVSFLDIRSFPANHGFYVFIGDTKPSDTAFEPVGIKVDDSCLCINVAFNAGVWARCITGAFGGSGNTQSLRLDVTVIPGV